MSDWVLRPYQLDALENLRQEFRLGRKRIILYAPTGCHARGELIMASDGSSIPAEKIAVGDLLMGESGIKSKVLSIHHGRQTMAVVTPVKGDPFKVNIDHILSLVHTQTGEVVDISVRDWLRRNKTFKHEHKLYRVGVDSFGAEHVSLPIHPWLLGVMLGDGSFGENLCVSNSNPMIQERVLSLSLDSGVSAQVRNYGGGDMVALTNRRGSLSNPLRESLTVLGLSGKTAHGKFVPSIYKFASKFDRAQLLAGLLDTDGHLSKGYYDWISVSELLADDIVFIARSLGFAAYKKETEKWCQTGAGGTYWRVSISGNFSELPTVKHSPFERKQIKNVLRTGFSVGLLPEDEYFGWEIDGNHRYLMADFTVTHNSGKTECAMEVIRKVVGKAKRVAFICNRLELIGQASRRFHQAGIDHGIVQGSNTVGTWKPVTVCSIQTLARRGCPDVDLLVIDEAHGVAGSKEYRKLIQTAKCPVIGLTATPFSRGLGKHYDEFGGPLFEKIVMSVTISDLIKLGHLVDVDIYAPGEPDLSGVDIVSGDYHKAQLGEAVDKPALIGDIVQHWFKLAKGKPTVCFATNIAHSKHIIEQFKVSRISAEHIDWQTEDDERRAILRRVESGETKIISNVGVLAEGWDCPTVEVMILARPTRSLIRYIQMVGRVLRPAPGKDRALLLDHSGSCKRLGFPTDDLPLVLDDGKPKKNGESERKEPLPQACAVCTYMKPPRVHKCPQCGFAPEKQSDVVHEAGTLTKLSRKEKLPTVEKEQVYAELLGYAERKGYSKGWAYHQLHAYCGTYPARNVPPREPSPETLQWIRHRQIKWAKSKEKNAA